MYLQKHEFDDNNYLDSRNFSEVVFGPNYLEWMKTMKDKLASMYKNNIWDLEELPISCKVVGCKWGFKTK